MFLLNILGEPEYFFTGKGIIFKLLDKFNLGLFIFFSFVSLLLISSLFLLLCFNLIFSFDNFKEKFILIFFTLLIRFCSVKLYEFFCWYIEFLILNSLCLFLVAFIGVFNVGKCSKFLASIFPDDFVFLKFVFLFINLGVWNPYFEDILFFELFSIIYIIYIKRCL